MTDTASRHRLHPLRVTAIEPLANDAVALTFEVPAELQDAFDFLPGQHIALVRRAGGDELRRSYSVCSPPGGPLRVAVKRLPGGAFSTWVHDELREGDALDVLPPSGRFTTSFDPGRRRHYAAIAAGSGITPVLSIVAAALAVEPASRCTLVYGNRTTASIMFLEDLADLKNRYPDRFHWINVLSREPQDVDLAQGRIDRAKLELIAAALVPPGDVDEWFLCGPFDLVDTAQATLRDLGVDQQRIHRELFHTGDTAIPSPAATAGTGDGSAVTIVLDGRRTTFTVPTGGQSILDAALAARPDAPYACKGGVCGTCRCRLLDGDVRMDHAYALEDDERRAGLVLACQSHPETPSVVLDFDAA
jgi:ring-1,2-phenylacetyl-CoA epoxidase subunit PaaE